MWNFTHQTLPSYQKTSPGIWVGNVGTLGDRHISWVLWEEHAYVWSLQSLPLQWQTKGNWININMRHQELPDPISVRVPIRVCFRVTGHLLITVSSLKSRHPVAFLKPLIAFLQALQSGSDHLSMIPPPDPSSYWAGLAFLNLDSGVEAGTQTSRTVLLHSHPLWMLPPCTLEAPTLTVFGSEIMSKVT